MAVSESEFNQLKNKVELLRNIALSAEPSRGLYVLALNYGWDAQIVPNIFNVMNSFLYETQTTYRDLNQRLNTIGLTECHITSVINYFAQIDTYSFAIRRYLETLFNEQPNERFGTYGGIYRALTSRYSAGFNAPYPFPQQYLNVQ